jgi:hypothetical protein
MNTCKPALRWTRFIGATAVALLLPMSAFATIQAGQNDGLTLEGPPPPNSNGDFCMQKVFGNTGSITSSNLLNCTANDVSISKAVEFCVQPLDANGAPTGTAKCGVPGGADPVTCNAGEQIQLTAKFQVNVTASSRFDETFYFRVDGGDSARGTGGVGQTVAGQCSLTNLRVGGDPNFPNSSIVTEAKASDRDSCGDLNQGTSFVTFTLPVTCADNGSGKLKLPNCTSWHSNSATQCSLGAPTGDSAPETKSKCNCDDGFSLDIFVEHPTISVDKTASPTQLNEPGGSVSYTVKVTNDGSQATVTLTSLTEDDNNNGTVDFTYNSTSNPTLASICGTLTLAPGASTNCTFNRTVTGSPGENITDKACASGTDSNGGSVGPSCDTAVVSIKDVLPTASLSKTAKEATCADIRYEINITNTDAVDDLSLDLIHDDKVGGGSDSTGGDVSSAAAPHDNLKSSTCALGTSIAKNGGTYTCNYVVSNVCTFPDTDTVTAKLSDGDGNQVTKTGSATVNGITLQLP